MKLQSFEPGGAIKYHGPKDGLSRPAKPWLEKVSNGVLSVAYQVDIQGAENLPRHGSHVYAPNHPGYLDPLLLRKVAGRDLRYMAAIENFSNPLFAKLNVWSGAFPVNRKEPSEVTKHHAADLLKTGANLAIFPEGHGPPEVGKLGLIKPGAAVFAVRGEAESIVPMSFHYTESPGQTDAQKQRGLLLGGAAGAAALVAGACGGPLAQAVVGTIAGALTGAFVGGTALRSVLKNPNPRTPFKEMIAGVVGASLGGVAGALTGHHLSSVLPSPALGVGSGAATAVGVYGLKHWKDTRDVAHVTVAPPLQVSRYVAEHKDQAITALAEDLHRSIGGALAAQSGIPYDDSAPKLR